MTVEQMMNQIENLTVHELRKLFVQMDNDDLQHVVNALRALAGDTESIEKLQRLHVSIEQGINKLLKVMNTFKPEDQCEFFICQHDNFGEIAINHCKHPDNPDPDHEGNCTTNNCPLHLVEGDKDATK